jgi:5'(3')-deoxyribonucleotidase
VRRLVIAVDCDDVLVSTTPFLVDAYNKTYGTNAGLAQARDASAEVWGDEEDVVLRNWAALCETDEYKSLSPDPREATILRELAKHHELHLITARKPEERAFTQQMLDRELKGVFSSMEFVGWTGSKGEVCKRLGADVLIDDNAGHLHDAIEQGMPKDGAILFGDYPWNEADNSHEDLTHCFDWDAVKNVIDELAYNG